MTATETTIKWTADASLGKIMAKRFNDAWGKMKWAAKTVREITDYGTHDSVMLIGGTMHPEFAAISAKIHETYGSTLSAANYKQAIADVEAATKHLQANPQTVDRRSTPEERDELQRAREEREAKQKAEAERIATFTTHDYQTKETASEIKRVLSTLWPDTKFSVTSERYSGGHSITATWTDGPNGNQVKAVLDVFQDTHFDGMTDSTSHSGALEFEGHRFNFRSGYCSATRNFSADFLRGMADLFATETGLPAPEIKEDDNYCWVERTGAPCGWSYRHRKLCHDDIANDTAADLVNQMAYATTEADPTHPLTCDDEHSYSCGECYKIAKATVCRIILGQIGSLQSSPASPVSTSIEVRQNDEKDGVEIRFPEKPATEVLDKLKANGWRWSKFSKCWYAKRTPKSLAFAEGLQASSPQA